MPTNNVVSATKSTIGKTVDIVTSSVKSVVNSVTPAENTSSKPDQAAYNKEQDDIKNQIDELQKQMTILKEKIGLATGSKNTPAAEKRTALRAELDELRSQQGDIKASRGKILDQLKSLQESISKKSKDLQASKSKAPFKTTAEVDAQVKKLEAQVESGSMKLVDEKRALQDISSLKRQRRVVETFQGEAGAIDADKAKADELRKQLDDPEQKALAARYEAIQTELDELKKEADESYNSRQKLFDQRTALQAELDDLYNRKRESNTNYREASDRYWQKVSEDRARKAERARATRAAAEEDKKKEVAERMREEADAPAYQAEIEDCQTLIDYFSGTSAASSTGIERSKVHLANVPELELRKVDDAATQGLILKKKKGEEEENYFVAGKGKKKGGKSQNTSIPAPPPPTPAVDKLQLPLAKLSALMSLSIPPPTSSADIPQTIENLRKKKEWLMANQERQTAENKAKVERDIASLTKNKHNEVAVDGEPSHVEDPTESTPAVSTEDS